MHVPSDTFLDRHQESNPPQTAHFPLQSPQYVYVCDMSVCVSVREREKEREREREREALRTQHESHRKCLKGSMGQIGDGAEWSRIPKRNAKIFYIQGSYIGKMALLPSGDICYSHNTHRNPLSCICMSYSVNCKKKSIVFHKRNNWIFADAHCCLLTLDAS